jgi:hypothetical protein
MRLTRFVQTLSGSPCPATPSIQSKSKRMSLISMCFALMVASFAGHVANAQTLVLTKTPAVTDIYSRGVQAFPATAVGTNSAVINLKLTVTGGALTVTSIAVPTSTVRIQQFTVGTVTGCTLGASSPTGTVCTVPITFNPAYVGYQTSPLTAVTSAGTFQFGLNGVGTGPQAILLPGILSTVAGNGTIQATATRYTGDGGQATAAQVFSHGFVFDSVGNLYEAEYDADVIRKITPAGVISTVIGAEVTTAGVEQSTACTTPTTVPSCGDGALATTANFGANLPDIALDSAGNLYVADSIDNRIRRVDAVTNIINTIGGTGAATTTGSGNTGDGGLATAADLNTPEAVVLDNADNIYMLNSNASQTNGSVIRYVSSSTGIITTLAGTGVPCTAIGAGTCGDGGQSTAALLAIAASFYVDPTTGNMWIADRDANRIRFINRATGIISTVAGTGAAGYTGDGGLATAATLTGPHGIWVDPAGDLYIADRGNNVVRYVSASTGIISTIAGGGAACAAGGNGTCGDGGLSNGPLANLTPDDIRLDVNGNIYVADQANNGIRKITTSPITLTFPSVPVGATSGPLTAVLRNIGTSTLTYTTPTTGTNAAISTTGPSALASNAFAQGNTTTCGPISSGSAGNNTLAVGAACNFVVTFTPDTVAGNYTGTLIETDNSLNSGTGNVHYPTNATQTVNLLGTATKQTAAIALTSVPNPSTYGTSVAFTATLSGVGTSVAPTGTVTFTYTAPGSTTVVSIGSGTISTVNGAQVATINYALFPVGTNTVTATYSGDANYAAGTTAVDSQVVNKAAGSADTLTAAPTTSTFGTQVTLTFTVPTTAGLVAPTGNVVFTSGGVTLGTVAISTSGGVSTAVVKTTTLPVGSDTVTATYGGDANYGAGAPTAIETVTQAAGTDTLTAAPATSQFGSPVVLTFTVPTVAGASANPTGTVTFTSGGVTLGTGTLTTTGTGATAVTTATLTTSSLPVGTDTITGTYPGDTNYSAQAPTATETVAAATGTYTLTAAPATSQFGSPVVLTFTVPLVNGIAPTGTVTFTNGTTTLGTGAINAAGQATLTTTALPVGTDTVKGSYPGDTNYATGTATATETVAKDSAPDTLTVNPTTSTFGSPVVVTFTIPTVAGATAAPTGTVTFSQGTTTLGTGTLTTTGTGATAVTTATLTTSSLPVGTDTVIGTYPGDANYANAAPTATETVTKATPIDTLTYSPTAPTFGAPVTLTFTIPTVTGATAPPTGTVTFTNGATQLGTGTITTVGGVSTATITTTALPVGSDVVTATYPGDTNYAAAAPTATVPVTKASPVDTLAASPTSSSAGTPVVLTFTIPTIAGATTSPTGTVTFTSGGVTLGTGTLSTTGTGATAVTTATLTTSALPVGTDTITGTYPGDANYSAAAPTTTETVGPASVTDTLTANPAASTFGTPVVLTFTVPLVNGVAPTGTVTFTNGTTTLGTGAINASGQATLTTTALPVGTDTVNGSYPGDANYTAGTATATETVRKVPGTGDTLTANPTTSTYGSPVVLTFTIPTVAGATASPTGTVTFTQGTTTLGTGTLTTTGTGASAVTTATLTTSSLPVGSDTVIATYPGDANYSNAAPTATETVTPATPTDTLTYSPSAPTYGSPVVLTFTIPPVAGAAAPPTGTVTFTNGATQLGTGTITTVGGVSTATITTTSLPVGNDVVTATYPGNGSYAAAAPTATVPVTKASGANDTLTVNPTSTTLGSPVVLTFTVPTVAGAAASPTGTVTFTNGTTTLGTGTLSTTGTGAAAVTTATLTTSALPLGTDTVTGTYPGDANYGSGSATATETVNPLGTDTLTATPSPATYGAPVTLTFTVPTVVGAPTSPTGTVTFTSGGVTLGTGTINTVGGVSTATLVTTALPVGTDTITGTYPGSPNYPAAAPTTTETINKAGSGTSDTLTANPTTSTVGSPVVLTFTVLPVVAGAALPPTGTVTFTSGGVTLGTGTLSTTGTGANAVTTATLTTSTLPVGTDTVTGTYPGDTNYVGGTATATETVNKGNGNYTLTVNPTTTTYGASVLVTFTVPPIAGLTTAPTGSVTFTSGTQTLGTAAITTTGGVSTASITTTALPVGSDLVTGTYAGDTNYGAGSASATETVTKSNGGPGGPTLSVNPTSSNFGSPVVVTYNEGTVAGATLPATGTVVFTSGGVTLGTGTLTTTGTGANAVTTATITTSALPVGTDTVTGTYGGDTNYNGAAPTATETVNAVTGDSVTASPSPATYGAPVTLTFNVPTPTGASTNPTGTVTFTSGGVTLGTAPIATLGTTSTATITTTVLPVGMDTITATYGGSPNYPAAAPTTVELINKGNAIPSGPGGGLTTSPNPSIFGQTVTITQTLTTTGALAPTGTVTFFYNGTTIGTGTVSGGVATTTTATLPVGTDPITSTYSGDANYATGNGGPANQVVNLALPTAVLNAGPNPATFGTPVTLTETITPINGTCPVGPATFLNNGTSIGTGTITMTGGYCVASITTATLPVGSDPITATVPASGGFDPITSGPVALVINKANGPDTLASNPNPSVFGSPVTITDTIPTVAGTAPTGTVNFFDFGVQIGTGTVNAQGVATLVTSTLPVGTDSLTATYLGDRNYAQVTAGPVNQVVTTVISGASLAVGPNPTTFGTSVTFIETIPITNGTPATGQVLFYQHNTLVGAGTLAGGIATISTTTLPVGTDPITATYIGDTNYAAVNSGPVNEVINKANGPDTLAVSPDPAIFGSTVTMTDTIPTVGGVAPTGTVTFYNNGTAIGTAPVVNGVATLTSTTLPVGSDPITATYGGDGNYATVTTGPVNEIVIQLTPLPVLGANPNPAAFGTTVALTESIPGINGVIPTGSVTFYDSGTAIGTAPLVNGVATLPTSTLPIGTDPVTATYTGDTNYATANSGPLQVVITTVPPADTLTATPNPSTFGSPVTLTFTVPPVNGVAPTGTVTFYDGTTPIGTGTISPSGIATLTTSQLPFGTTTVTAKYPGDNTYAPASPTTTVTVNPVSPISVVTVPPGSPICGSSVTLTDTITLVNGVALGGTVQFYDNGTAIGGPIPVPASGIVTLTTTSLACTTDLITAIYTPPANSPYLPSTGGPTSITVNLPDFSITATPPNQTVNPGDTTTYTVSLSGVGQPFTSPVTLTATGLPPGATLTFANGTLTPNAGPTSTTMTIVTAPNQAVLHHSSGTNGIYYGLLLLPLLGLGKVRRRIKALPKGITYCLAGLLLLGGLGAMTGCGGGYFGPAPQTFTITVTGTSGTLVHSTTVTLTVR